MNIRTSRATLLALAIFLVAACGANPRTTPPTTGPSAAPSQAPATYAEFSTALCASFTSLIRAVGNPDVNSPSIMSKALDDAVAAHDAAAADRAASAMLAELETGRQQSALAARWEPAAATMVQMDRLLVAFEALTKAKQAAASGAGATADPQKAFEQAGGVQAWTAAIGGIQAMPVPSGASPIACKAFSGQV